MITNPQTLPVLVDHDNIDPALLRVPYHSLVGTLLTKFPASLFSSYGVADFRFYGGWYDNKGLTQKAQKIAPELARDFPRPYGVHDAKGAPIKLIVHAHLAASPLFAPRETLYETYARNRPAREIRCAARPWTSCALPGQCGLQLLEAQFAVRCCKIPGCTIKFSDILTRDEQKLVDTLIVADVAHLALKLGRRHLALISSDTDMWPGILLALTYGCEVFQLHPNPKMRTPARLVATTARVPGIYYSNTM